MIEQPTDYIGTLARFLSQVTVAEWITIAAVITGPIAAVSITLYFDGRREKRSRKWEILRDLMLYRKQPMSRGFVGALNLIEVEFHGNRAVLDAWDTLLEHEDDEEPSDHVELQEHLKVADEKRATLIQKIACEMGIEIDSSKIYGGVHPERWSEIESLEYDAKERLPDFLAGSTTMPVAVTKYETKPAKRRPKKKRPKAKRK